MKDFQIIVPPPQPLGPDAECPHDDGPYHFWSGDGGPFSVLCDNCGAEGHIIVTEAGTP